MKDWKRVLISPTSSIRATIETIDNTAMQIAVVVDGNMHLKGTVTDGDIRRGILRGVSLDAPVSQIMNSNPVVANTNETRESILAMMRTKILHHIPVVNDEGSIEGIQLLDEFIQSRYLDNPVVLMAGGLGSRLSPLTKDCPKPLLKIGNRPILETILENFIEYGFRDFYIAVNYKAEMVERYFGDGSRWAINIKYIRENKRLGTAGALSLLPDNLSKPLFVMNGDLLTRINFLHLLNFHNEHSAKATMCVRDYHFQVPYGVVKVDKHKLVGIEEKPIQQFFVSGGIYVLQPEVLKVIPKNVFFDMPNLFDRLIEQGMETAVFPIREYWLDIGRMDDYERANGDYSEVFE